MEDEEGSKGGGGKRKVYTCRRCGLPKKGHRCLAEEETPTEGATSINNNPRTNSKTNRKTVGDNGEGRRKRGGKQRKEETDEAEEAIRIVGEEKKGEEGFRYYVVLDLEATCDVDYNRDFFPQEIIEFSAVIVDAQALRVEDSLQLFVKPVVHPKLTPFCINLTGITQDQVDAGISLSEALQRFEAWLIKNSLLNPAESSPLTRVKFCFATWTDWDLQTMLEDQCSRTGLHKPEYFNKWVDLKACFLRHYKRSGRWTLEEAVQSLGLEWNGRAHSGIDDCINTANLLLRLHRVGGLARCV